MPRVQARMKAEMIEANARQMQMKSAKEAQRRAEEDAYKARMMAKFAEDDRMEQMNAQRRRMKTLEHRREVRPLAASQCESHAEHRRYRTTADRSRKIGTAGVPQIEQILMCCT